MKIISRKEAKALGLKRYFTGKPCRLRQHIGERRTGAGTCVECASLQLAKWRKQNPDAARLIRCRYIKKNLEKVRKREAAWQKANPEKVRMRRSLYRERNLEKVRAQSRKSREKYREKYRAYDLLRRRNITDLLAVLRETMPELLEEFGI